MEKKIYAVTELGLKENGPLYLGNLEQVTAPVFHPAEWWCVANDHMHVEVLCKPPLRCHYFILMQLNQNKEGRQTI